MNDGTHAPHRRGSGIFARRYRSLTVGMITLVALFVFETLAVTTAMPTVARALHGMASYALAFAGTMAAAVVGMVAAGIMADERGPQAPLRLGIVWFAAGLLAAGLAPAMWVLLLGRIVQGFGGGLMSVALYVVVGRVYPTAMHARVFTAFAAAYALPAMIGPTISGLIVQHAGWRWVFLSVPVIAVGAAAAVGLALGNLDSPPSDEAAVHRKRRRVAWAVGAAAGVLLLHEAGRLSGAMVWPLLAAAVTVLAVCAQRLFPAGTLRVARGLPSVIALRGIASAAFFGTEVFLPLMLSRQHGLSPSLAGLALTLGALGWSGGSWYRGRMADAAPVQVLRTGFGLIAVGIAAVTATIWPVMPIALAMAGWALAGCGMGVAFPTLSVLTLQLSPAQWQGAHSSALQLSGSLCTATVLALTGALFAALQDRAPGAAYLGCFAAPAVLAMLGLLLAARVRPR